MLKVEDLLLLFKNIDSERTVAGKLLLYKQWAERQPEIYGAKIICFDNCGALDSSETAFSLPAQNSKLFPREPAVLNGRSAIPQELFLGCRGGNITVYYPFFSHDQEPAGALLFRCDYPKRFLHKNSTVLMLIASKLNDILYTGKLRTQLRDIQHPKNRSETLTPEALGNLMNFLALPMYITDKKGTFLRVNERFLKQFQYRDLDSLNQSPNFFIGDDDWSAGLRKLFQSGDSRGYTIKIRTGAGSTRVVQDSAALIGRHTFGVLFDITEYIDLNNTLEDALEDQKNLNEQLINATSLLRKTQTTAMKSLAMLAEYRDMETGNHLHRICEYNKAICQVIHEKQPFKFHISSDYVTDIYLSGMLHDIGKVGVPDSILLKEGSLSQKEWEIMRRHTVLGWDILHQADLELGEQSFLTLASRIALAHHEHYDGMGYPKRLSGENIPLSARISAISDVYDALTSRRPYKEAWSHDEAIEEILSEKGQHFDPVLVEIVHSIEGEFLRIKQQFPDDTVPASMRN